LTEYLPLLLEKLLLLVDLALGQLSETFVLREVQHLQVAYAAKNMETLTFVSLQHSVTYVRISNLK
jgi:hypothetical protein